MKSKTGRPERSKLHRCCGVNPSVLQVLAALKCKCLLIIIVTWVVRCPAQCVASCITVDADGRN